MGKAKGFSITAFFRLKIIFTKILMESISIAQELPFSWLFALWFLQLLPEIK
jgi:hypothetical protein